MKRVRNVWLAFALLCLISGSLWMLDQSAPSLFSGPAQVAVHDGLLAAIFALASLRFGGWQRPSWRFILELLFGGLALIGLPALVSAGSAGSVSSLDGALVFCLVPAFVVFLVSQSPPGFGVAEGSFGLLLPALLGPGGAALVLPSGLPASTLGRLWLLAILVSAVLSALAAIRLHRALQDVNLLQALAILCAAAALFGWFFYSLGTAPTQTPAAHQLLLEALRLLIEAILLLLTMHLLRNLAPIAFSTRFVLVPLITILESLAIERPRVPWTTCAGILLMAASVALLLRAEEPGDAQDVTHLHL